MWRTMVLPLLNAILILIYYEKSKANSWRVLRLMVGTFKKFMMIPKNTSTSLVYEMIGVDISALVAKNIVNSEEKWEARKERRPPELIPKTETPNYLRGIPNEWCQILKQQYGVCGICKQSIRNEYHMSNVHNIDIFDCKELWECIKEYYDVTVRKQKKKSSIKKVKRTEFLKYWEPRLKALKEDTTTKFDKIYPKRETKKTKA
jgi:hypothetical protein